jgi:hypothetical protein
MCLASVSLWAEATWYRLTGDGQPGVEPTSEPALEPISDPALLSATSGDHDRDPAGGHALGSEGHELVGQVSR